MQITKKDIVSMVGIIKANYTYAYRDTTEKEMLAMVETWYLSLAKYDKEIISVAFQRAIESCKMPPTLADIMQQVKTIKIATEPTDTELWERLVKVLNRVEDCVYRFRFNAIQDNGLTQGDNARIEFRQIWDDLPQILKEYCGDKNGLISLSKLTLDELSFEKGRFLKAIPNLKVRQEVKQTISPSVLKLVSGTLKELSNNVDFVPLLDTK